MTQDSSNSKVPPNWPFPTYRGVSVDRPVVVETYYEAVNKPKWENVKDEPEATF